MALANEYSFAANGYADRVISGVSQLAERLRKAREFRKTLREMQSLSNRELSDLGLNRSMLRRIAYQAVYEG